MNGAQIDLAAEKRAEEAQELSTALRETAYTMANASGLMGEATREIYRLRALNEELVSALNRIMDYAYTGARISDVDPSEQPQFVTANELLSRCGVSS